MINHAITRDSHVKSGSSMESLKTLLKSRSMSEHKSSRGSSLRNPGGKGEPREPQPQVEHCTAENQGKIYKGQ